MNALEEQAVRRLVREELERREHANATALALLADLLRHELAEQIAAIDKRITTVHERALRALTDQHSRRPAP